MPEIKQRYFIVKENPVRIKDKCRSHSRGTLAGFLAGVCILYIMLNWVPELLSIVFPVTNIDILSGMEGADQNMLRSFPSTPVVVMVYSLLFTGVFNLGEALYALTYIRNRKVEYRAIAESMQFYLKTLAIALIQGLIVSFWTMLFIVPGIIAAINFSQAYYILADDPSKGVTQVLAESKIMMYGNKMSYVRLIISYIPNILLGYIPMLLVSTAAGAAEFPRAILTCAGLICEIPIFIALGYMILGRTVFYELMINRGFAYFKYAGQDSFRELENPSA